MSTAAASTLFPDAASVDPMLNLAAKRKQENIAEVRSYGKSLFEAKQNAFDEAELAAFKNLVGPKAQAAIVDEITRLESLINDPSIRPDLKEKFKAQIEEQKRDLFISSVLPDYVEGTAVRNPDRTRLNKAKAQIATTIKNSSLDLMKLFSGMGEMVGDTTKWEYLSDISRAKTRELKAEQRSLPQTLSSYKDINTNDSWSAIQDTGTYVGNLIAGTVPQLAVLVATGGAVGLAGLTGVAGFAASTALASPMYIGKFYANQPEDKKNAPLASALGLSATVFDKLGLEGMVGGNLFTMAGKEAALKELSKRMTMPEAKKLLEESTKRELVSLTELGSKFANQQYRSAEAALRGIASVEGKGLGEAFTESAQQYAEMMATRGVWNTDIQYEKDFWNNIIDAAVGGKVMGVSLGSSFAALDAMQWHSAANSQEEFKGMLSEAQLARQQPEMLKEVVTRDGEIVRLDKSIDDVLFDESKATDFKTDDTFKSNKAVDLPETKGTWDTIKSLITRPSQLMGNGQLSHQIAPKLFNDKGQFKPYRAMLKAVVGGHGILSGDHYARYKQKTIGSLNSLLPNADDLSTALGKSKLETEAMIQDAYNNYWSKNEWSGNKILDDFVRDADNLRQALSDMTNDSFFDNLSSIFEASQIDPDIIVANKERLINKLIFTGVTRREANKTIDQLVGKNPTLVENAKNFLSQKGIIKDPELADLFKSSFFSNLGNLKQHTVSKVANDKYFGKDGQKLVQLLQKAKENGEFDSDEEFKHVSTQVKAFYLIANGNYKEIDNELYRGVVAWGTTMAMLSSLGKAAFSSLPESVAAILGTRGDKVTGQLYDNVRNLFTEIRNDLNKGTSWALSTRGISYMRNSPAFRMNEELEALQKEMDNLATSDPKTSNTKEYKKLEDKVNNLIYRTTGRKLLDVLGYSDSGYATQTKYEYADHRHREAMNTMAHLIGLRALTDSTRISALSAAADTVMGKLNNLRNIPAVERETRFNTAKGLTVQQAYDLKDLVEYGIDVNRTLYVMDNLHNTGNDSNIFGRNHKEMIDDKGNIHPDYQAFVDNIYTGISNFVDSKVVNPQVHNLPRFYHDPRLRLITAMTRFMATAHSTLLPTLYKQYIKDGNVGMRYQAFAVVMGMILASMIGNAIKDELAYEDGKNPYIKGYKKEIQRNIYGSGLLGQYERVVDTLSPLYPENKPSPFKDPFKWSIETAKDNSPAINWASKPISAAYNLSQDKVPEAVKQLVRAAPVVGSFPIVSDVASSKFK
jgi:hypothetical protein